MAFASKNMPRSLFMLLVDIVLICVVDGAKTLRNDNKMWQYNNKNNIFAAVIVVSKKERGSIWQQSRANVRTI
jgi:hypothetical protein